MSHEREPFADLVRTVAIWGVVVGHWLAIAVTGANGTVDGRNALGILPWTHPLTWLVQVMPLFFLVGGFANAGSLARHRAAGGDGIGWVARRYRRLLLPASALLGFLAVAVVVARAAGADADAVARGAWVATVPLWFLAVYLVAVALAPLTSVAHRRWGLAVPLLAAAIVAAVDAVRIGVGESTATDLNYLVAWLAIHPVGYLWHDGRLPGTPRRAALVGGAGLAGAVVLVAAGPWPVSMVAVPGADLQNTEPPSVALLAYALGQIGLVLALRDRATRWLRHDGPRAAVGRLQPLVFALFLWHMAAAVVVAVVLYGGGVLEVVPVDSAAWLRQRVPWLVACAAVLAVFVAVFARLEQPALRVPPGGRTGGGVRAAAAVAGVVLALGGMLRIALAGSDSHGPLALPTEALVAFAAGTALACVVVARSSWRGPAPQGETPTGA